MLSDVFTYAAPGMMVGEPDSFVAVVPREIDDGGHLLDALYDILNLPGYFGFNLNALADCLRDLHWIKERNVVLIHEDLPALARGDLANYIEVLDWCARDWGAGEDHQLVVVFPEACRENVERILGCQLGPES